jgi:hypothetical protein
MKWFSHRRLILTEALLIAGLAQMTAHGWIVAQSHLPAILRVLLSMALVLGVFGGLIVLFQRSVSWGLDQTVATIRRTGLATHVLPHILLLGGLFWSYARFWGLDGLILRELLAAIPL